MNEYVYTKKEIRTLARSFIVRDRTLAAKQLNAPMSVLKKLAKDTYPTPQEEVARNPNSSAKLVRKLVYSKFHRVRSAAISHQHAPVDLFYEIADKFPDEYTWSALAKSPDASVDLLERFASCSIPRVLLSVIENRNVTASILIFASGSEDREVLMKLFRQPYVPVDAMEALKGMREKDRALVAQYQGISRIVAETLIIDSDWVFRAVMENRYVPYEVLFNNTLTQDELWETALIRNFNTPSYVLDDLTNKFTFDISHHALILAGNKNISTRLMLRLAALGELDTLTALSSRDDIPESIQKLVSFRKRLIIGMS